MIIYLPFFILIVSVLVWATLQAKDAYPFSNYPMFSQFIETEEIEFYRVAFETQNKEIVWWKSHFFRNPQFVGNKLKELSKIKPPDLKSKAFITLEKKRLLKEVVRLWKLENADTDNFQALQIIKRTATVGKNQEISIRNEMVERIPLKMI